MTPDRPIALQLCPLSPAMEAALGDRFDVVRWFEMQDHEAWLEAHAAGVRAVVTGGHVGIANTLMEQLPSLGVVAINGVGFDKVDLDLAGRRGVRVSNTPDVLTEDVADLAVGLVIALLRGIVAADRHVRDQRWPTGEMPLARKVSGRRFGIVGLGRIGAAIAERLSAFGPVSYTGRTPKAAAPYAYVADLAELAQNSDVLVLSCAANAQTKALIGPAILDALGPSGVLVNVARGAVVDEAALIGALAEGRIAGAALDVYADEPRVPKALIGMPNVILTPHIASATEEGRRRMAELVLENLDAYFAGTPMPTALV